MQEFKKAEKLLRRFKGDKYHFGQDILGEALKDASKIGRKAILFRGSFPGSDAKYLYIGRKVLISQKAYMEPA